MKKFISILLIAVILTAICPLDVFAAEDKPLDKITGELSEMTEYCTGICGDNFSSKRLLIKASVAPDAEGTVSTASYGDFFVYQYAEIADAVTAAARFAELDTVEFVEPDRIIRAKYNSWGYEKDYINIDDYKTRAGSRLAGFPDITVAVLDSGVDFSHPYLKGRIDCDNDYDFVDEDDEADESNTHGTHVAGTIIDGTPENVKILPVKTMDADGYTSEAYMYLAIRYAIDHNADVINISAGGFGQSSFLKDIIDEATAKNIIVVVSAGNENTDASRSMPANVESAITVAAIDKDLRETTYTNYGTIVDISAPGDEIVASVPFTESESGFISYSGTSMAAPHVSAVVACLKMYDRSYTTEEVLAMLKSSALPVTSRHKIGCGCICIKDIPQFSQALGLDKSTLALYPGQSGTLTASENDVIWTSSDEKIATVSGGKITAVSEGKCDITASIRSEKAVCKVTVSELEFVFDSDKQETIPQVDIVISYRASHNCPISWSTSDESIATVDSLGHVYVHKRGKCTITAVAAEGTVSETVQVCDVEIVCPCPCHATSGISAFFWKILRFFYKLFGTNKNCPYCGEAHY